MLGSIELRQGELAAAEQEFDQAIRLSSKFSVTHCNLGLVLQRKDDRAGELREFPIATEVPPTIRHLGTRPSKLTKTLGSAAANWLRSTARISTPPKVRSVSGTRTSDRFPLTPPRNATRTK